MNIKNIIVGVVLLGMMVVVGLEGYVIQKQYKQMQNVTSSIKGIYMDISNLSVYQGDAATVLGETEVAIMSQETEIKILHDESDTAKIQIKKLQSEINHLKRGCVTIWIQ